MPELLLDFITLIWIFMAFCLLTTPFVFLSNKRNSKFETYFKCECGARYVAPHDDRFFLNHTHCPYCGTHKNEYKQSVERKIFTGKVYKPWTWRQGYWEKKMLNSYPASCDPDSLNIYILKEEAMHQLPRKRQNPFKFPPLKKHIQSEDDANLHLKKAELKRQRRIERNKKIG